MNHFLRANRKGYINVDECDEGTHAARKALKAVNGLIRYLDSTPGFGKIGRCALSKYYLQRFGVSREALEHAAFQVTGLPFHSNRRIHGALRGL